MKLRKKTLRLSSTISRSLKDANRRLLEADVQPKATSSGFVVSWSFLLLETDFKINFVAVHNHSINKFSSFILCYVKATKGYERELQQNLLGKLYLYKSIPQERLT